MHLDEPQDVAAARAGDHAAWEALYRRLYPKLRAFLLTKVGPAHVEDAVSETMARAVRNIDGYKPGPSGFDGWVFGIGRRVAADHHRKTGRTRRQDTAAAALSGSGIAPENPGERLDLSEEQARLRRAFERLASQDRELLELRVVAELSVEQVAAVLGKRPGAVRTAQSRALQRLRKLLEADRG